MKIVEKYANCGKIRKLWKNMQNKNKKLEMRVNLLLFYTFITRKRFNKIFLLQFVETFELNA